MDANGRQTDSFNWDTNPHPPRLYFKSAPPLHLPRHKHSTQEPRLSHSAITIVHPGSMRPSVLLTITLAVRICTASAAEGGDAREGRKRAAVITSSDNMLTTYYSKGILLRFDTLEDMRAVVNSSMTTIKANKKRSRDVSESENADSETVTEI